MDTSIEDLKHNYEEMKDNIEEFELFNKWKDAIDITAENGFKTLDNIKLAVVIYLYIR